MKQFARCTNCRQWYNRTFTNAVEVYAGNQMGRMTVWCLCCIQDAEQRSQWRHTARQKSAKDHHAASVSPQRSVGEASAFSAFQQLVQEHLQLMERAIHEDDAVIVPIVEEFMQRCRLHHEQLETPEHAQRLWGHVQYWETFLQALRRAL